jgi:hypothetical protein
MRTKALLACAALAAGLVTSAVAQSNVYSLNIVGYVNTTLNAGFTLLGNPLDNGTNDLNSLFPNATLGDAIFAYANGAFTESDFFGTWSTNLTIPPGKGLFYSAGAKTTNTFVGNVLTGSHTNKVNAGFNLVSSMVPIADTLGSTNINLPANLGDAVFYYRNGYVESDYFGTWSPDLTLGVGEAFWLSTGTAGNWVQNFNP